MSKSKKEFNSSTRLSKCPWAFKRPLSLQTWPFWGTRSEGCVCPWERTCGEPRGEEKGSPARATWGRGPWFCRAGSWGQQRSACRVRLLLWVLLLSRTSPVCRLPHRALKGECFLGDGWLGSPCPFSTFFSFLQIRDKTMFCHWLDQSLAHKCKTQVNLLDNHWHGHTHLSDYFDNG